MSDPTVAAASPRPDDPLYTALSAPFSTVQHRKIGGEQVPYLTGEQVTTRLNEVLGPQGWDFLVLRHGFNAEADEYWCEGRLTIRTAQGIIHRDQFGSNKVTRARQSGNPLDIGFDLKGAATDALKKCATLVGIGLDLTAKGAPASTGGQPVTSEGFDWTVIWTTLRERGISPEVVQDRCGVPLPDYVRQHSYTTQAQLLADPRLQP